MGGLLGYLELQTQGWGKDLLLDGQSFWGECNRVAWPSQLGYKEARPGLDQVVLL